MCTQETAFEACSAGVDTRGDAARQLSWNLPGGLHGRCRSSKACSQLSVICNKTIIVLEPLYCDNGTVMGVQ